MPYPEEASTAEMVNYTVQALWSYGYMKTFLFRFFIIIPRVTSTPCHHPDIYDTSSEKSQGEQVFCKIQH